MTDNEATQTPPTPVVTHQNITTCDEVRITELAGRAGFYAIHGPSAIYSRYELECVITAAKQVLANGPRPLEKVEG